MRQRRWMKFLKYYDFELLYYSGKANVVVDALSRKIVQMSSLMMKEMKLVEKLKDLSLYVEFGVDNIRCGHLTISSVFLEQVKEK